MKTFFHPGRWFAATLLFLPASAPWAAPASSSLAKMEKAANALSLRDCLVLALQKRFEIGSAARDTQNAADQVKLVKAAVSPSLTADGSYVRRNNDMTNNFGGRTSTFGDKTVASGKVRLLVPLFDSGGTPNRLSQAKANEGFSRILENQRRLEVIHEVSQRYFALLEAREQLAVVQEAQKVVAEQRRISQDFYSQGLVAKNDVLAVEVRLAERQQDVIRGKNAVQLAVSALNRAMGLPPTRATTVAPLPAPKPQKGALDQFLETALAERPEMLAMDWQEKAQQAGLRAGAADLRPKFAAFTDLNVTNDQTQANKTWLLSGLSMQWTMFDSGVTQNRQATRQRGLENLARQKEHLSLAVQLEVEQAYLNAREASERVPVAQQATRSAQESLRVIRDQYGQGLVSSADVLVEEERLARARQQYFSALFDHHRNLANLYRAIGQLPPLLQEGKK